MKMRMWSFDGDKIQTYYFWKLLHYGVGSLLKSTSSTVIVDFFKQGINFVDIMKICMWSFDGNKVKLDRTITAF